MLGSRHGRWRSPIIMAGIWMLALLSSLAAVGAAEPKDRIWTDAAEEAIPAGSERRIVPERYRTVVLDPDALDRALAHVAMEGAEAAGVSAVTLSLPLPDGGSGRLRVVESPVMDPGLAAKFPEIRTYRGQGLDDPTATVRFDRTPSGFHAMILSGSGTIYVDPYRGGDAIHHISYHRRDYRSAAAAGFRCEVGSHAPLGGHGSRKGDFVGAAEIASGTELRTYRTVVAATVEYADFHGGTVAAGMAAIVTAMNRVNGIFERDVA